MEKLEELNYHVDFWTVLCSFDPETEKIPCGAIRN